MTAHAQAPAAVAASPAPPVDVIAELIRRGDHRAAVAACARIHGGAIGRMCMALLGSQSDAEEMVQETLLAAHRGIASFRAEGTVRSWLFAIARRQCAQRLERSRREPELRAVPDAIADGDPADAFAVQRRARAVRAALAQLKPSEREALVLRYDAGLDYREIAAACGIDEAAARKRASRGLEHLRSLIEREESE